MAPRFFTCAVCALLLVAGSMSADAPLISGPQVGAGNDRDGFTPKWITGPCAGKRLCPV
jgi:hypothetical protein